MSYLKKKRRFTKNTFIQGAFVATLGIVISKIMGMIYVIPFHAMIGEQGGALYGYAYNIYSIFLSISTAGIPLAISSITSEYNTLGYYNAKERVFRIARKYLSIVGIACFLVLFLFAKEIAYLIIGNIQGGNTIEDITLVIRVISFSVLVVPMLSVYRGYLQGHRYITPTSVSQVLEQLIRVSIIIVGSYLVIYIFDLPIKFAVSAALFGATLGSVFSLIYLIYTRRKHKKEFKIEAEADMSAEEIKITDRMILKQILLCAFPFVFCDVCKSLYNSVDTFFVVKTLVQLGYSVTDAETVMGVISTWGNKLNMIVIAIGTGFSVSMIPNLAASLTKHDHKDAEKKINLSYQSLAFLTIPMTLGLSFLSVPVWNIFYGSDFYGPIVFRFSIMVAIVTVLLSSTTVVALSLKEYKMLFVACIAGLLFNAIFDVPFMYLLDKFTYAFYGATLATCLGHLLTIGMVLFYVKKKYGFHFKETFHTFLWSLFYTILMLLCLSILSIFVPLNVIGRVTSFAIVVLYALLGGIFYLFITYKTGLVARIFGEDALDKVKNKVKKVFRWNS